MIKNFKIKKNLLLILKIIKIKNSHQMNKKISIIEVSENSKQI